MLTGEHDKLFHQAHDSLIYVRPAEGTSHLLLAHTLSSMESWQNKRFCQDFVFKIPKNDKDMKTITKTIDNFNFIGYYYLVNSDKYQT